MNEKQTPSSPENRSNIFNAVTQSNFTTYTHIGKIITLQYKKQFL